MYPDEIDATLELMPPGDTKSPDGRFRVFTGEETPRLMLHRRRVDNGMPVLLLHGASAGSDTFLTPRSTPGLDRNLVDFLAARGFEPWLLDWRGSKYIAEQATNEHTSGLHFNFGDAATQDIAAALDVIFDVHRLIEGDRVGAVGFCMGGGILAQALFANVPRVSERLSRVVLMSLGLFYRMSLSGRLKAESRLLERVIGEHPAVRFLDPRIDAETGAPKPKWPVLIENLYSVWRPPYSEQRIRETCIPKDVAQMFNRISFMLGEPYRETKLVPEIQEATVNLTIEPSRPVGNGELPAGVLVRAAGDVEGRLAYPYADGTSIVLSRHRGDFQSGQDLIADGQLVGRVTQVSDVNYPLLPKLFGAMPLKFLIHGAENLRVGRATSWDGDPAQAPTPIARAETHTGFDRLDRITLIGGALNRLWHRDSIDRMAAWLERNRRPSGWLVKHILADYGHQDLLWGREASKDVFPLILKGLQCNYRKRRGGM